MALAKRAIEIIHAHKVRPAGLCAASGTRGKKPAAVCMADGRGGVCHGHDSWTMSDAGTELCGGRVSECSFTKLRRVRAVEPTLGDNFAGHL